MLDPESPSSAKVRAIEEYEAYVMNQSFDRKIAVVTGAASGIGYAVAQHLAERGARIVGIDLNERVGELIAELPGAGHLGIVKNLTDPAAAAEAIAETVDTVGIPQILVNSAGIALLDPAVDVTPDRWQLTLDVNLSGTFYMAQAAGRVMLQAGYGRIINLASQAAVVGLDQHAAYCASKAAVVGLTHVLSLERARHGVTVNAVSPTVVETASARPHGPERRARRRKPTSRSDDSLSGKRSPHSSRSSRATTPP